MPTIDTVEMILRVLTAGGLGALVGLDRELADQPAGLRTHVLVALGAALFTLSGAFGLAAFTGTPDIVNDPTRVAAQIVTGIGFLGAGAIIRQGFSVRGLTTAAGLWVTAAIGMAAGFGFYEGAIATTVAAVVALYGMKRLERLLLRRLKPGRYEFIVDASETMHFHEVTRVLEERRCRVERVRMDTSDEGQRHLLLQVRLPARAEPLDIVGAIERLEGVQHVDWSG